MRLSTALAESAAKFPDYKCCDVACHHVEDRGNSGVVDLSYRDAWTLMELHREWLFSKVQTFTVDSDEVKYNDDDIVVAYLSSNSIDMFLSMLACTSLRDGVRRAAILPALLNIRWTPREMAKALESRNGTTATTLVLYGPGFEAIAKDVVSNITHYVRCLPLVNFSGLLSARTSNAAHFKRFNEQYTTQSFSVDGRGRRARMKMIPTRGVNGDDDNEEML